MWSNESAIDRAVRVMFGIGLLALVFVGPKSAWGLIGIVPLATGLVGFCPLYRLVGIDSCRVKTGPGKPQHHGG
ncbi:MAG: DUF2892 domain-containing protein [Deltaproteobacteria bacterium]